MSRLSNDTLCVSIAPWGLSLLVRGGFVRRFGVRTKVRPDVPYGNWAEALVALDHAMMQPEWDGCKQLQIVVSSHWIRYLVLPWNEMLLQRREAYGFVRASFQQVYGETATRWKMRLAEQGYGKPILASAIDNELLEQLATLALKHEMKLTAVSPDLSIIDAGMHRQMRGERVWLMFGQPGLWLMGSVRDRCWHALRVVRHTDDALLAAERLVEQEKLLQGLELGPDRLYWLTPVEPRLAPPRELSAALYHPRLPQRSGFNPAQDGDWALAALGSC